MVRAAIAASRETLALALFMAAHSAMPMQPVVSLPLTHPDLGSRLAGAARRIGYRVI